MLSRKSAPKYRFFYKKVGKKGGNRYFSAPSKEVRVQMEGPEQGGPALKARGFRSRLRFLFVLIFEKKEGRE